MLRYNAAEAAPEVQQANSGCVKMQADLEGTHRGGQIPPLLLGVFICTVVVFLILITFIFTQQWIPSSRIYFVYIFFPGITVLTVLGIVLIIMAARAKLKRNLKWALILTGVSVVGMPVCAILHNAVYGLFILMFGEGFWGGQNGGDEAFFFILALIVFPVLLIVSSIASAVLIIRAKAAQ
jgi:hypothetical protein